MNRQGDCGGTPKRDGSGGGTGNRNTPNQPIQDRAIDLTRVYRSTVEGSGTINPLIDKIK